MISKPIRRTLIVSMMIALALAGAFLFTAVASSTSHAAEAELSASKDAVQKFMNKKRYTALYLPNRNKEFGALVCYWSGTSLVKNLKSSSSAVEAVLDTYYPDKPTVIFEDHWLKLEPRRAGSSKISFTYRGKKLSTTVKVVRYTNPFRSFKLGKRQVKSYFDAKNVRNIHNTNIYNTNSIYLTDKKKKALRRIFRGSYGKTLKVALNRDWKMVKMYREGGGFYKFKNGSKIKKTRWFPYDPIHIVVKNKKTGAVCSYSLSPE